MNLLQELEKIKKEFRRFSSGIRVVLLIDRSKNKDREKKDRFLRKIVTKNSEEFFDAIEMLLKERFVFGGEDLRIYSSLNERDINKAIRLFKFEMLENDYQNEKEWVKFYFDIKNRFISCLMRPGSAKESLFLVDVDDNKKFEEAHKKLQELTEVIMVYKTKKGKHIVVKPFNPALFEVEGCEIKKDALLLLNY